MGRTSDRIRIGDDGRLEVVDPGFDILPLLREIDPDFEVQSRPLPGFVSPGFLKTRDIGTSLTRGELAGESEATLWRMHVDAIALRSRCATTPIRSAESEASLLDLKRELARRILEHCRLCAHRCAVDRTRGEAGICRLGTSATVGERFVHIGEEGPFNPSLVLNLAGCGLRCRYCQQWTLLNPSRVSGEPLDGQLWSGLEIAGARSLSFVGGNPDESLYAILSFLNSAPRDWNLPIVWNCHAYSTQETVALLEGVIDVYVPDFKYGNDECAQRWASAPGYVTAALETISAMVAQDVPVIVRILVLPGHVDCCHLPTLELLSTIGTDWLMVSIRDQYCPDWLIDVNSGAMARRPISSELARVRERASLLGMNLVDSARS